MYPGRELNPYRYYYPQDFKSCVSTSSTTRAKKFQSLKKFTSFISSDKVPKPLELWNQKKSSAYTARGLTERKTGLEPATPTLARLCSTKWATSAYCIKYRRTYFLFFRPPSRKIGMLYHPDSYRESYFRNFCSGIFKNKVANLDPWVWNIKPLKN